MDLPKAKARKGITPAPRMTESRVVVMGDTTRVGKVAVEKQAAQQTDWSVVCSFDTSISLIASYLLLDGGMNSSQRECLERDLVSEVGLDE